MELHSPDHASSQQVDPITTLNMLFPYSNTLVPNCDRIEPSQGPEQASLPLPQEATALTTLSLSRSHCAPTRPQGGHQEGMGQALRHP